MLVPEINGPLSDTSPVNTYYFKSLDDRHTKTYLKSNLSKNEVTLQYFQLDSLVY